VNGLDQTLRVWPAMAAGISDRLWSMDDVVALMGAAESEPKKPRQRLRFQSESLPNSVTGLFTGKL